MSRSGKERWGEQETAALENVRYLAADCLKPLTFQEELADVDAVVHCVGALFESKEMTYDAMNRDSCINMANELN